MIAISWLLLSSPPLFLVVFLPSHLILHLVSCFWIKVRGYFIVLLENLTANRTKNEISSSSYLPFSSFSSLSLDDVLMLLMIQSVPSSFFPILLLFPFTTATKWTLSRESRHGTGFVIRTKDQERREEKNKEVRKRNEGAERKNNIVKSKGYSSHLFQLQNRFTFYFRFFFE